MLRIKACQQSCFAKIETALDLDVLPMKDALKYAKSNDALYKKNLVNSNKIIATKKL